MTLRKDLLLSLPSEMIELITLFLEEKDIVKIASYSREFYDLARRSILSWIEELELKIGMEPPNSRRRQLFLRHRRKLPKHVTIYYPQHCIRFLLFELKSKISLSFHNNSKDEKEEVWNEQCLEKLMKQYWRNRYLMRLSFLQAQLKLYGMKYRELENTCYYLKEYVQLIMEEDSGWFAKEEVKIRWHKYIMKTVLVNILDSLAYYHSKSSISVEYKVRLFEAFSDMIHSGLLPYITNNPYITITDITYRFNKHHNTIGNLFFVLWKYLPPKYEHYKMVFQFNKLIGAGDMPFAFFKYLAEVIVPQTSSASYFSTAEEISHFCELIDAISSSDYSIVSVEEKNQREAHIEKIQLWLLDNHTILNLDYSPLLTTLSHFK